MRCFYSLCCILAKLTVVLDGALAVHEPRSKEAPTSRVTTIFYRLEGLRLGKMNCSQALHKISARSIAGLVNNEISFKGWRSLYSWQDYKTSAEALHMCSVPQQEQHCEKLTARVDCN